MGLTTNLVRGERAETLLLLVHGLGADEKDLAGLLPHLDPDGRFVCVLPRGPYGAPPGYGWFRFDSPALMASTLSSSLDAVDEVLDEACDVHGFAREDSIVGGFSQGAALTLALAFRPSERPRPRAVLAMSGFLPPEDAMSYDWQSPTQPPVLMQHGTEDPLIQVDRGRQSAQTLASHGVPVVFQTYPMGHQVAIESIRDANDWLSKILAGERPSEDIDAAPPAPVDTGPVGTVTSATFDAEVLRSDKPVIVDFWAPWCQPCRAVAPVVEQIAVMRKDSYKVVKLNVDEAQDIAQRYDVRSIPMVALFRGGRMERKSVGAKPRPQLEAELGMLVIP